MKATVAPFKQPPSESVVHSGWRVTIGGREVPLPSEIEHWDYQTTLHLTAGLTVNRDDILFATELGDESELNVAILARSSTTGVSKLLDRIVVSAEPLSDLVLETQVDGYDMGGRLELTTQVVTTRPAPNGPLSARRMGSILWSIRHSVLIEGIGARFPTDAADFRAVRPNVSHAGWYLSVDRSDPNAEFMSCVRLTLNTAHPEIQDLLGGKDTPETKQLQNLIYWDVARQLIYAALDWEDEIGDQPAPQDDTSLRAILRRLLSQYWPMDDPSRLRRRLRDDPGDVEVQIQQMGRLFGG